MFKKIVYIVLGILIVLQLFSKNKNKAKTYEITQFIEETKPSVDVQKILSSKCYDCHTNKTNYPWYSKIAPLSFWINHHVEEGKEHLDLSNWSNYNVKRKIHKLEELVEEVEEDKMPLESYEILHGGLSLSEKNKLIKWAKKAISNY